MYTKKCVKGYLEKLRTVRVYVPKKASINFYFQEYSHRDHTYGQTLMAIASRVFL